MRCLMVYFAKHELVIYHFGLSKGKLGQFIYHVGLTKGKLGSSIYHVRLSKGKLG